MEFRYVYRRVEDAIGSSLAVVDSPHAALTRRLRYDLRELRSLAWRAEITATSLASLGGNPDFDAGKLYDSVSGLLDLAIKRRLPYVALSTPRKEQPKSAEYDKYFAQLEEFKKSLAAKKAKEAKDAGGASAGAAATAQARSDA